MTGVNLLGSGERPTWTWDERGLAVDLPARPPGDHAFALRILTRP